MRKVKNRIFTVVCLGATILAILILVVLLGKLVFDGAKRLNWSFISNFASMFPAKSGIKQSLVGSLFIMALTALITVPVGVAAAIYLEEFTIRKNRITQFIQLNIANLSGVPSIVYGLLGLAMFVTLLGLGKSILAGALTMSILILPMVILVSQEALKAVPNSFREGSMALGATRWQTIRRQVLPAAMPGILTGVILSLSRAIGETAPLITVGAIGFGTSLPKSLSDRYTVLPIQIFQWSTRPQAAFHENAAAAILVLMVMLLAMNSVAIVLRARALKRA
jgi:phosphate transport system permease protein